MPTASELRNNPRESGRATTPMESNGIGDLLMNNPLTMQAPEPTMEQPKLEENKSLWRSFMDRIQNDPNMRMSLMAMGANMLRSPGFGQNGWDVAGNAIAQGVSTYAQGRAQQQQQELAQREQTRKETETTQQGAVSQQNANTYGQAVTQQGEASRANATNQQAQTAIAQSEANLNAELKPRQVAAQETSAQADLIRANASKTTAARGAGGNLGQNERLVNQRKAALMALNPALSDEEATLQAQNELLRSRQAGNPATIARDIFNSNVALFQGNLENLGKSPTQEQIAAWRQDAIDTAKAWSRLGQGPETTSTSGVIDRTPTEGTGPGGVTLAEPESVVGRKVQGTNGIGEITGQNGDTISLRLPNGKTITTTLEKISPYIIAE